MKKVLTILCLVAGLTAGRPPKTLKVELSLEQWQSVLNTIEESNAPHQQVKIVQGWVIPQLQAQLDTTKNR